jgi:hypothetical protein
MNYIILAIAGFISWVISTIAAGGGGLLMIPVITFLLGAQAAPPILGTGELIGSSSRAAIMRKNIHWEVVKWYLPGGFVGSVAGAYLFTQAPAEWFQIIIGLFLISTLLQYHFGEKERTFKVKEWYFLPASFGVSFLSGLFGTMGPILNTMYLNYGVDKEDLVATKSVNSTVEHVVQLGTYLIFGALTWELASYGLAIGVASIAANWIGKKLLHEMESKTFRRIVIVMMAISGIVMIWQQRELLLDVIRLVTQLS